MNKIRLIILLLAGMGQVGASQSQMRVSDLLDNTTAAIRIEAYIGTAQKMAVTRHEEAEVLISRALKLAEATKHNKGIAQANLIRGKIQSNQGNLSGALEPFLASLEWAYLVPDTLLVVEVLLEIADVQQRLLNFAEAREALRKAENLSQATGDLRSTASVKSGLANYYWQADQDSFPRAFDMLDQSIAIQQELADTQGLALSYTRYAILSESDDHPDKAEHYYLRALQLAAAAADSLLLVRNQLNYGSFLSMTGDPGIGLEYLEAAAGLVAKVNNIYYRSFNYLYLSDSHASLGNHQQALEYYRLYNEAKDEVFNEEKARELAVIQNNYEARQQRQEMELLQKEARIRSAELKNEHFLKRIMFIGFSLIILILYYLDRMAKKKMETEKALLLKDQEIQRNQIIKLEKQQKISALDALLKGEEMARRNLSQQVHEELGSLLSAIQFNFQFLRNQNNPSPQTLENSNRMLNEAITEIRRISHEIMPGALIQLGLEAAVADLCHKFESIGMQVGLQCHGLEGLRLDPSVELTTYRLLRKILQLLSTYSIAEKIDIHVQHTPESLQVRITSNGKAWHPKKLMKEEEADYAVIKSYINYLDAGYRISHPALDKQVLTLQIPLDHPVIPEARKKRQGGVHV